MAMQRPADNHDNILVLSNYGIHKTFKFVAEFVFLRRLDKFNPIFNYVF